MPFYTLDHPHSERYYLFYKIVYVLTFLAIVAFLGYAAKKTNYNWNWSRIPSYFWNVETIGVFSEQSAEVKEIKKDDNSTIITLEKDNKETIEVILSNKAEVLVSESDYVYVGDQIASIKESNPGVLLEGLKVTINISSIAIVIGIFIGLVTGLCRLSDNPALRWWAITYIEIIRGSPLLVQIYLWYFVLGKLVDALLESINLPNVPPLWYGAIALATFAGAYVAEIVRAGIQSVSRGQMEAARSLGLSHNQAMRKIILPQAFRRILPPLAGQFISLIKDSSLLGVMSIRELTKATKEAVTASLQPFELYFVCAILYLVLTFSLSVFVQYLEKRAINR